MMDYVEVPKDLKQVGYECNSTHCALIGCETIVNFSSK